MKSKAGRVDPEPVINRPWAMTRARRNGERTVTVVFWWLWAFFLRPVIFFMMWTLGIRIFFIEIIIEKFNVEELLIWRYSLAIMLIFILLQTWNRYNYFRFHGKDRRKRAPDITDKEMGDFYGMAGEDVARIKLMRFAEVEAPGDGSFVFHEEGGSAQGTAGRLPMSS